MCPYNHCLLYVYPYNHCLFYIGASLSMSWDSHRTWQQCTLVNCWLSGDWEILLTYLLSLATFPSAVIIGCISALFLTAKSKVFCFCENASCSPFLLDESTQLYNFLSVSGAFGSAAIVEEIFYYCWELIRYNLQSGDYIPTLTTSVCRVYCCCNPYNVAHSICCCYNSCITSTAE